jgi:hypothetical protein
MFVWFTDLCILEIKLPPVPGHSRTQTNAVKRLGRGDKTRTGSTDILLIEEIVLVKTAVF